MGRAEYGGWAMTSVRLRPAGLRDAGTVAQLHADSWRRFYRGAYADSFLDGDVLADRRSVWSTRLASPAGTATVLAEDGGRPVGFVHVVLDHDERWGSLLDNLHVAHDRRHAGIGTALIAHAAAAVVARAAHRGLFLWVLEQNTDAQRFYAARGGRYVETAAVPPPGGVAGRLVGSPTKKRLVWPDAAVLCADGPPAGSDSAGPPPS